MSALPQRLAELVKALSWPGSGRRDLRSRPLGTGTLRLPWPVPPAISRRGPAVPWQARPLALASRLLQPYLPGF